MARILIVDDEAKITTILGALLEDAGHECAAAGSAEEGLALFMEGRHDLVVTDLALPGMSGLDLLARVREADSRTQVVMMTAYATVKTAVEAMRQGAFNYITKPFDNDSMVLTCQRALEVNALQGRVADLENELRGRHRFESLIGNSTSWTGVLELVERLGKVDGPVLVLGESGTGKERVARALHEVSPRSGRPFEAVNCGAVPESLVESTFFGHVKGAFTGADADRKGCFERADGGTLFLDEVGELSADAQVKLLRVLQEREVVPVGGQKPVTVDVRLVAATNRDLESAVADGAFREDLWYRLNVLGIELPPLRRRQGDVALLVDHFMKLFNEKEDLGVTGIDPDVRTSLEAYPWPGNVRELENAIYRMMVMAQGRSLAVGDLPDRITGSSVSPMDIADWTAPTGELAPMVESAVRDIEVRIITERLKMFEGAKAQTAESLGMSRKTLFNKMKAYGIG